MDWLERKDRNGQNRRKTTKDRQEKTDQKGQTRMDRPERRTGKQGQESKNWKAETGEQRLERKLGRVGVVDQGEERLDVHMRKAWLASFFVKE